MTYVDLLQREDDAAMEKRVELFEITYQASLHELKEAEKRNLYLKEKLERARKVAEGHALDDKNPFRKKY